MGTLRAPETWQKYQDAIANGTLEKGCVLCDKTPVVEFKFWKIIMNDFPYDRIAEVHHMLVPIRHVTEEGLSKEEHQELLRLKKSELNREYQYLLEATPSTKSIPGHFHIHLIVKKEE
jgi:diadenosine tetraphosphate (Ap4A) HIT family hydrolase